MDEVEKAKLQLEELKKQCSGMLHFFFWIAGFIISAESFIFCFVILEQILFFENIVRNFFAFSVFEQERLSVCAGMKNILSGCKQDFKEVCYSEI